jgi:hypothetical protein
VESVKFRSPGVQAEGIVVQHVDAAVGPNGVLHQMLHLVGLADIGLHVARPPCAITFRQRAFRLRR